MPKKALLGAAGVGGSQQIAPSSNDWDYTFGGSNWPFSGNALGDNASGGFVDVVTPGDNAIFSLHTFDGAFDIEFTAVGINNGNFGVVAITEDDVRVATSRGGMNLMSTDSSFFFRESSGAVYIDAGSDGSLTITAGSAIKLSRDESGNITLWDDGVLVHTFSATNTDPMRFCLASEGSGFQFDVEDLFFTDYAKIQRDGFYNEGAGNFAWGGGEAKTGKHFGRHMPVTRSGSLASIKYEITTVLADYNAHFEIYTSDGTSPVTKIGGSSTSDVQTTTGEKELTFSDKPTLTKGDWVWVVIVDEDEVDGDVNFRMIQNTGDLVRTSGRHDTITSITEGANAVSDTMALELVIEATGEPTPGHETLLLIHSNTTDGSTTFTDSSQEGRTITVSGDTQHDTAQSKFGTTSIYFDGTDYLEVPDADEFSFVGDFTIDFWVRTTSETYSRVWTTGSTTGILSGSIDIGGDGLVAFRGDPTGSAPSDVKLDGSTAVNDGSWNHIAVVRTGDSWVLYINGTSDDTATSSIASLSNEAINPRIGMSEIDNFGYVGWVDEFRVLNYAAWDDDFTPQTIPYP
jgi:hypothetical protein